MSEDNEQQQKIPLDGSFGAGVLSEVTIITKGAGDAERSETFTFPAALVNYESLLFHYKLNLILGFKLMKQERVDNPALKELGL